MDDSSPDRPRAPRPWLPAACAALLACALYAHTLAGEFVYDDLFHAADDPRLRDVGLWAQYWTDGYYPGGVDNLWRPLISMSYAVQYHLHGPAPWAFHLVNVLLHAAASALVAELARRLTGRSAFGLIAGLIFAAHPVHVEAVAYVVGRAESACAAGVLGAMVLATRPLTVRRALSILACVAAAVLSKEQGLLAPAMVWGVLALCDRNRPVARGDLGPQAGRLNGTPRRANKLLALLTLFALTGYVLYREHILPWAWDPAQLDWTVQPLARASMSDRALIPLALLGRATALLVLPVKLSPEYGLAVITPVQRWDDPYLYVGLASAACFLFLILWTWRRRARTELLLLACAALSWGMIANVFLIGVGFAERLLYLPSAFLIILAAIAIAHLPKRAIVAITAIWAALLGARTVTYAATWNDRLTFYQHSLADQPRSVRLHVLLTAELLKRGDLDAAERVNDDARALAPDYWKPYANGARIATRRGQFAKARQLLDRAWALKGDVADLLQVDAALRTAGSGAPVANP